MTVSFDQLAKDPTNYLGCRIECHGALITYSDDSRKVRSLEDEWYLLFKMWLIPDEEDLLWLANMADFAPKFEVEIVSDRLLKELVVRLGEYKTLGNKYLFVFPVAVDGVLKQGRHYYFDDVRRVTVFLSQKDKRYSDIQIELAG